MRLAGQHELAVGYWVKPVRAQVVQLPFQDNGVNDYAVANEVERFLVENARRDGVKHVFLPVKLQGMASVGSALETRDQVIPRAEDVHDFPFSFIAPLKA